ncbi:hypothetical protein B0T26DRAFT_676374 [Lasiosphaeria miniovina]|uniref:Aminoglycoside phosphotransferase domain-containing protein n=1 Tax=Lasiosphaeria miniovina TaxID=1954250 RepID=A0AA40ALR2_9PEZI|nr:uncharacterized protein B0T26DRAFT_676374 [Lasiosphaeria miniovina]KAK0718178.1 hypothetical protein B0T26DRAFT_676374 [Lasiosphaeria miniovina]
MQLLRRRTSIPVPHVFEFSKIRRNPLGYPHIWLSFIAGIPLYNFWHAETPEEDRRRHRTHVLKAVASAMVQLSKFSYQMGGRLLFDTSGPYTGAKHFYTTALDSYKPDPGFLHGQKRLLKFFIGCMDEFFAADRQSFKFLVDEHGNLAGIIDWDGVGAWLKSLGNLSYPDWLTRDWDPEDTPQTLVRYRRIYQAAIRDALVENKVDKGHHTFYTSATLITENLRIAPTSPMGSGNILRKIVNEIAKVDRVPCTYGDEFLYMELCETFGKGKPSDGVQVALRAGFTELLQSTTL